MKEAMDAITKRRAKRAVDMVRAESCVFFMDKGDPELNGIIAAIQTPVDDAFRLTVSGKLFVDKLTGSYF